MIDDKIEQGMKEYVVSDILTSNGDEISQRYQQDPVDSKVLLDTL